MPRETTNSEEASDEQVLPPYLMDPGMNMDGSVRGGQPVKEIGDVTSDRVQLHLFRIWLDGVLAMESRRSYKVPGRITALPCGCHRERGNEVDINNAWHLKRKGELYVHTSCGKSVQ